MTGEKNRFKTHEQLWKLEDGELSTPKHDELVLQLLKPENAIKFLSLFGYDPNAWKYKLVGDPRCYDKNFDDAQLPASDSKELQMLLALSQSSLDSSAEEMFHNSFDSIIKDGPCIQSEVPIITGYNNFIIGYLDIVIETTLNIKACAKSMLISYPVDTRIVSRIVGRDLSIYNESCSRDDYITLNIEVKPVIKSFGETLRQINTYRAYSTHGAIFCIYSPDTKFKSAFEDQGIKFVTPSDLGLK